MKKLLLFVFVAVILPAQVGNGTPNSTAGSLIARAQLDLERQKVDLEERRLYLSTLERSTLSEEKAREVSSWILQHLRGYPQGRNAKNVEEDTRLIMETLASLTTPPSAR